MLEPFHLRRWAHQFIDRNITFIFPGWVALRLGIALDPHHQLNLWNHCEPPPFLNCPQVAYRTVSRVPYLGSILAGCSAK